MTFLETGNFECKTQLQSLPLVHYSYVSYTNIVHGRKESVLDRVYRVNMFSFSSANLDIVFRMILFEIRLINGYFASKIALLMSFDLILHTIHICNTHYVHFLRIFITTYLVLTFSTATFKTSR